MEPLLADPRVTEVMVNGPGEAWVERDGRLEEAGVAVDRATLELLLERIVAPLGLRLDPTSPMVDARLPDGSRVNAVLAPIAVDGPCLTIRRFGTRRRTLEQLAAPPVAGLLAWAVQTRRNVLVSGGTGAGKTTLLGALAGSIPPGERLVTIEDAAELRLAAAHVVRLEARPATADGLGAISVRDLVRNALRMRPDRIIVGEVRGAEALEMVQAMNTGHEGSLSTCHANAPLDALRRLETMVLLADVVLPLAAVREQIHAAIDLVVHLERSGGGDRHISEVVEVVAEPGPEGPRARRLATGEQVVALPERPPRRQGMPAPDKRWLS